jgi:hypothetical protein
MRGIDKLHPEVMRQALVLKALCESRGLNVLFTDTLRTMAEQDALYAKGRTVTHSADGKKLAIVTNCKGSDYASAHQWGVALDFCQNVKGKEYSDLAFFGQVGAIAKTLGFFWGGDFKGFVDRPHLEYREFMPGCSTKQLKQAYGSPEKFMKTWEGGTNA